MLVHVNLNVLKSSVYFAAFYEITMQPVSALL